MKKTNKEDVCNKCGERGRFLDRGTWWCAWENKGGAYNLVGRCKNEKKAKLIPKLHTKKLSKTYKLSNKLRDKKREKLCNQKKLV